MTNMMIPPHNVRVSIIFWLSRIFKSVMSILPFISFLSIICTFSNCLHTFWRLSIIIRFFTFSPLSAFIFRSLSFILFDNRRIAFSLRFCCSCKEEKISSNFFTFPSSIDGFAVNGKLFVENKHITNEQNNIILFIVHYFFD